MEDYQNKAKVLIEALPYIKKFNDKIVVVKYGGSAMTDKAIQKSVIKDIALMRLVGINPVIVHGGGKDINDMLDKVGKDHKFINGLRFTDFETMEIVQMVLAGKINKDLVGMFSFEGMKAIGITGQDGNTLIASKHMPHGDDLGYVGKIENVNVELILKMVEDKYIPIIAPIGADENGKTYNINADTASCAIANALKAEKLIFMSDIKGVLKKDKKTLIQRIRTDEIDSLIEDKTVDGGMIPKLQAAKESVLSGVNSVHIIDGRVNHSLLLETFTDYGIGTMIV